MNRDPAADKERLRTIQGLAQAGQHAQAAALAQRARADGLEHPLLYNVLALRLESEGHFPEAEGLLQSAVRLAPGDVASRNALGLCLMRLERPEEALAQFESALASESSLAFIHANRGTALFALRRVGDAEASFQRALALDERHGVALAGLAHIGSSRGLYAEARARAERALQLMPGYPEAVVSLVSSELGERKPSLAEARVRDLLSREDLQPLLRAFATGLLGDALDAQDRMAEAFSAYSLCNRILREAHGPRFDSGPGARRYARALLDFLQRADTEAWRAAPLSTGMRDPASGHIFVLGFPRSGTTLLEVVLEGHPQVISLEEKESLIDGVQEFMQEPQDLDRLLRAPPATLDALRESYWRRVAQSGVDVGGKIFVDKYPLNTLKLPLIARLFPTARILFACRDPRDVVLSCFRHRFRMNAPMYELLTLEGAAAYYDAVMRVFLECMRVLPLESCIVRHEDVVSAFTREMRRICEFLQLEWVPAMEEFALRTQRRTTLTPSTAQLARGLNASGVGRWRRYRAQLEPVLPLLAGWVSHFQFDS
ncbi:MAG: tetratricopeptide repeat-containing sulfotransferase family protein [Steroidobacteraceae bacterium]